ncbi:MAG: hypothetical protein EYC70_16395 [Planctomycetota bacterium]|nr:MAG: hypothetical protein EYC70_16395 [Planctomycetota bacterium]
MSLRLVVLLAVLSGCMKAPEPPASAVAADPHAGLDLSPAGQAGPSDEMPRFSMPAPEGWTAVTPDQSFYLAKWTLPEGGQATVSFNVGSPAQNLQRWYGQWEVPGQAAAAAAEVSTLEGTPWKNTTVVLRGTLQDTRQLGGGPPREDWMLVGAILEPPQGPVFVKVIAPRSVLEPQLPALWDAVRSARIEP